MDRDGWLKVAVHFVKHCGPTRPQHAFYDAHDSHWCSEALKHLRDNGVYSFFTRAHMINMTAQ